MPAGIGGRQLSDGQYLTVTPATGAAALSETYTANSPFYFDGVTFHLSAVPSTSENFLVTLTAVDGSTYSTILYSVDIATEGVSNVSWQPDGGPLLCEAGDTITVTYTNTDTGTYGLRILTRMA